MFRYLRIAILLTILVVVAGDQWLTGQRLSSWEKSLWITVYPVLLDSNATVRRYAESLHAKEFEDINTFLQQQAARYGRQLEKPAVIQVARPLTEIPPALPTDSSGLKVALWSLKMRWWSWRNSSQDGLVGDDIKMYVLYQADSGNGPLERSVGVKNAGYGIVNAVASRKKAAHNRIVITHELLHILGASDKYDRYTGQPVAPDGLANPGQSPLYPQIQAEIMAGRIADSANHWRYPATLKTCAVGTDTASEIGW